LLSSGLPLYIEIPKANEMVEFVKFIIEKKFDNFPISNDAIKYISDRVMDNDLRKLIGMINKIYFFSSNVEDKKIFLKKDVIDILNDTNISNIKKIGYDIDPEKLISKICNFYKIKISN
jgi:chromosomal replication initiation ATPase DnaA